MKYNLKFEGSRLCRRNGHMTYVPIQAEKTISAANLAEANLAAEMVIFRSNVSNARSEVTRAQLGNYVVSSADARREKLIQAYSNEDARIRFESVTGKKAR